MTEYITVKQLGRGSFGCVEHVKNKDDKSFALKKFSPNEDVLRSINAGHVSLEELKRRFSTEAKYQQQIDHPNIIKVYESNLTIDPPFFTMELAEGVLSDDLSSDNTLNGNPRQALFDILSGLEAIHQQGIYHRDLKPANIMRLRNPNGEIRYALSDFGLIKVATGDATTYTATGAQGGTERYAAPELMSDFKRATARSDIFSFGVILFDIFVGMGNRIPYTEVQFAGAVGSVASKCTKKLAARRYASIAEVRSALYDALQNETPIFGSNDESDALNLLRSERNLTENEWDSVFYVLERISESNPQAYHIILQAVTKEHINILANEAPDLLAAFSNYYTEYIDDRRGDFGFDYCDVIADKLTWLFEVGDISVRARVLQVMLGLGVSHNRWLVERRFMLLASSSLDDATARRFLLDVNVKGIDILSDISHIERSIGVDRNQLSPELHQLWVNNN